MVLAPSTALVSHVTNTVIYGCMAWELDQIFSRDVVVVVIVNNVVDVIIVVDMEQVVVVLIDQLELYMVDDFELTLQRLLVDRVHGMSTPFL